MPRHLPALLLAAAGLVAPAAQATFISFDERPWALQPGQDPFDWSNDPITGEYATLGVVFQVGFLRPTGDDLTYTKSQFLLGGPDFTISFTDALHLPTHVSLSFSSPLAGQRATVIALGAGDVELGRFDTGGLYLAGPDVGWVQDRPYQAHSIATFATTAGIARLVFGTEGGTRVTAKIDNLYFGNVPAVPEPASMAMLAAGLGVIGAAWRRRKGLPTK